MNEIPPEVLVKLKNIKEFCGENCRQNELWPSYYNRRYLEFLSYLELFPEKQYGTILELGCGIGYQSALLSNFANEVIATDLPDQDIDTHTPGMLMAQELHSKLNINNVKFVACSAESLPFPDNSIDMVYSSHVLEHIPEQEKAVQEIYRVLKHGGIHFCVVPTSFEKIYSFVNYYLYLAQRSVYHLWRRLVPARIGEKEGSQGRSLPSVRSAANLQLKYFPFPPPHGHSRHFLDEVKNWTPSRWRVRIEKAAPFAFVKQSTTQFNPLLPLLGGVFPLAGIAIHGVTRKAERFLGENNIIQRIGINTVMIFKKPGI